MGYASGLLNADDPSGGLFLGGDARQFTLLSGVSPHDGVAVMPDGDVLVQRRTDNPTARLFRLGVDGRFMQIGSLPSDVRDLTAETPTTILTLPLADRRGGVERYNLQSGKVSVLANVAGQITGGGELNRIVALDDGSAVVTDGASAWRVRADGTRRVLSFGDINVIGSLAALPGGAFAYFDQRSGAIVRVAADGQRQNLARVDRNTLTDLASAGDELVAVLKIGGDVEGPLTRIITISGSRVQHDVTRRTGAPLYGNGDGYGPTRVILHYPRALLASDGSLLMVDSTEQGSSLRALVPQASRRLRIALRPSFWRSFARGRVDYTASTGGRLHLRISHAGQRGSVTDLQVTTTAGDGTLRLRRALPPGRYDVRLTLSTTTARTKARARILTGTTLSMNAARAALKRKFDFSDDEGGATEVSGRCVRRAPGRVACQLITRSPYPEDRPKTCPGWVVAQLLPDEIRPTGRSCDYED